MMEVDKLKQGKELRYKVWLTFFVAIFFIFSMYIISTADQYQIVSFESGYTFTADIIWFIAISWIVTTLGIFISDKLPVKTYSIREIIRVGILQVIICVVVFLFLVILTDYYLIDQSYVGRDDWLDARQLFYIGLCLTVFIIVIHNGRKLIKLWKESVYENAQMKEVLLQSQLTALKTQLDPHFMFNNYSVLGSLIKEDSAKASEFLEKVSDVQRYLLCNLEYDLVTLDNEVQFLKDYIHLIKIRFGDSIQISIDITEEKLSKSIPPMTLQLLVENASKHNKATKKCPLFVQIYEEGDYLVVENNIQLLNNLPHSSKVGLNNIVKRYHLIEEREVIIDKSEQIFKVKIPLI